ncbi:MAG: SDR family oxidoreductase [Gallionella sp.]
MSRVATKLSTNHPRIAIITGATSGIGEATARRLIAAGCGVVGNGRNPDKLRDLERQLGAAFCGIAGDASDSAILDQLFAAAIEHFGKPADIVVANAGRGLGGSVNDADLSRFEDVLRLNVTGTLALLQRAANSMIATQPNRYPEQAADIVIIGSVVGRHVSPFSAVYGATKFAVHGLAEGLRREVGPKGIRVTLVEPGVVVSGFQDAAGYDSKMVQTFNDKFGPLLHGEDIANAIHFVVTQPPHVHVSDIMIRPTRQDYP